MESSQVGSSTVTTGLLQVKANHNGVSPKMYLEEQ